MAGRNPQDRAKSSDREAAIDLIDLAHREGRIGSADRTIRKNNIATAATLGELDMITRDLAGRAPGSVAPDPAAPSAGPASPSDSSAVVATATEATDEATDDATDEAPPAAPQTPPSVSQVEFDTPSQAWMSRSIVVRRRGGGAVVLLALFAALVGVAIAGSVFLTTVGLPEIDLGEFDPDSPVETVDDQYAMDEAGFAWVIDHYRQSFGSTSVWQAVFYDGYVIFYQPNDDGSDSRVGWIYRDGGFTEFGAAQANRSGEVQVDLRRLDLAALVENIERARTTLNVEEATVSHVIVGHDAFAQRPAVTVYVTNGIGQNGFLQTDLRGKPIREFPYSR